MKPIDRIKEVIKAKKMKPGAFEKIAGISHGSLQSALKKNSNLRDDTLTNILNAYPDINPEWLLTGRGEMFRKGKAKPLIEPPKISPFFERIIKLAEYKGFKSINDFAINGLGYSSAEKINRLKKEENKPSYHIITSITNKFVDVNPNWLLTGLGEMLKGLEGTYSEKTSQTNIEDIIASKVEEKILPQIEEKMQSQIKELKAFIQKYLQNTQI